MLVDCLNQFHRFLFHLHDQVFDSSSQIPIGNYGGNRDDETCRCRNQRFGNAAGQNLGVTYALIGDAVERMDHAGYGSQQSKQRRNGADGAECIDKTFQFMNDMTSGVLDRFLDDRAVAIPVCKVRQREYLPQRRILLQCDDMFFLELFGLDPTPDFIHQIERSTRLACKVHKRSRKMAAAMTELKMIGAMKSRRTSRFQT